jgi:RNA polymerase sigma factor (sigma-70 family)
MTKEAPEHAPPTRERDGATRPEDLSDERLLERLALHQDPAAFAVLVRRHGPCVQAACVRCLGDRHAADDACQETFLVLLRNAGSLGQPDRLAGWLYGVAWRVALRAKTRAARRGECEARAATELVGDPIAEATWRDLCAAVAAAVDDLPGRYREALVLHYWEGKTSEEIARQVGCPLGSMSWRLGRGRELVHRRLRELAIEST